MRFAIALLVILVTLGAVLAPGVTAQEGEQPVVRAVLFYSPSCPHCHTVINEVLIPMLDEYGEQLQVIGIDITQPGGSVFYEASTERFQVPQELSGVPRLIVGETVLVGSLQIPQEFPRLVEEGLASGGIDWPDIPGLAEAMEAAEQETASSAAATSEPSPAEATATEATSAPPTATAEDDLATPAPSPTPTSAEVAVLGTDALPPENPGTAATGLPEGGGLAGAILGGMLLAMGFAVVRIVPARQRVLSLREGMPARPLSWFIPILAILGLGVALYLAYVEITHVEAVCGPVGECNQVQSSQYAQIAGIPVAVLGALSYVTILMLWGVQRLASPRWADLAFRALILLSLFGVLFSIYLTLLELFVIDAVCAWCLSSAVITTVIMLLVVTKATVPKPTASAAPEGSMMRART